MTRRELAQAMRAAIQRPETREDHDFYITLESGECAVCALGAALVEKFGGDYVWAEAKLAAEFQRTGSWNGHKIIAEILGISSELAWTISTRHNHGESIEQIAQWLESDPDWAEGWEDNSHV